MSAFASLGCASADGKAGASIYFGSAERSLGIIVGFPRIFSDFARNRLFRSRAASAAAFSWLILSSSSSQTICSTFPFLEAPDPSESGFDDMCAKLVSTSSSSRSFSSNPGASNEASASRCFSMKRDRSTSGSMMGSPSESSSGSGSAYRSAFVPSCLLEYFAARSAALSSSSSSSCGPSPSNNKRLENSAGRPKPRPLPLALKYFPRPPRLLRPLPLPRPLAGVSKDVELEAASDIVDNLKGFVYRNHICQILG